MRKYEETQFEVVRFDAEDVILASTQQAGAGEGNASGDGPGLD